MAARSNVACLLLIQSFPRAGDARIPLDFAYRAAIVNGCTRVVEAKTSAGMAHPIGLIQKLNSNGLGSRISLIGYIVHSVRIYDADDMILWKVVDI